MPFYTDRPSPAARYEEYQARHEDHNETTASAEANDDWAVRGDGAVLLRDAYGWFALVTDDTGTITAVSQDPQDLNTTNHGYWAIYCEPIWLSGYYENLQAYLNDPRT
jgi:hypothetical protein